MKPQTRRSIDFTTKNIAVLSLLCFYCLQTIDAAEPTPKAKDKSWVSLFDGKTLNGWRSSEFGGDGERYVDEGNLHFELGSPFTGLTRTGNVPRMNYEIELEAMRVDGGDFFCGLTFPVNQSHCSLIVGGWGGGLCGLSCLDGFDASENETGEWHKFKNDTWYKIKLRVEPTSIKAWINDDNIVDVDTTNRKIDIRLDIDPATPLGLTTWRTAAAFRNIRLRKLTPPEARKPNIVVILADDMGYGDASCYGGTRFKTPHLDALAAAGMRFTDFHSSGAVCSPTRAGLLTGRYQQRAGIDGVINADPKVNRHHGLQTRETTFAEVLQKAGYRTGLFGKWHQGYQKQYNPIHHGFDQFRGYVSGNIDFFSHVDRMGVYDWWHQDQLAKEEGYCTHLITNNAVEFIKKNKNRPFCVYIAHEAPHSPYQGPNDKAIRTEGKVDKSGSKGIDIPRAYREMMQEMDKGVGDIVAALKEQKLDRKTLVFFFSDNGANKNGSNGTLRGHKGTLWEGGHRVPAIASWPGRIAPGVTTDELAISIDLMPTMLAIGDVNKSDSLNLDGVDLSSLLFHGEPLGARKLFWQSGKQRAHRDGKWKYVENLRSDPKPALFDLSKDLAEERNFAKKYPDRLAAMQAAYLEWQQEVSAGATKQPEK